MPDFKTVSLDRATATDAPLLSNLLELYIHDLSAVFPSVELGENGRFGYPKLPLYWSEFQRRFAFLIKCDARVVGFVFATRGSPVSEALNTLDVAEFFVIRQYRHCGVGREAARILWNQLPGSWTVRVSHGNPSALAFWRRTIAQFSSGTSSEFERSGKPHAWQVFAFDTPGS